MLRTDTEYLDLAPDSGLSLNIEQPALTEGVASEWGYPFVLPMTARNRRLLRRYLAHAATRPATDIPATAEVGGVPVAEGRLSVEKHGSTTAEATLRVTERDLTDDLERVRVRDLMPTIDIPQTYVAEWVFDVELPIIPTYVIMINGKLFTHTTSGGSTDLSVVQALASAINNHFTELPGLAVPQGSAGSATLALRHSNPNFTLYFEYNTPNHQGLLLLTEVTYSEARMANFQEYILDELATPAATHVWPKWLNYSAYAVGAVQGFQHLINDATKSGGTWTPQLPQEVTTPNTWHATWCPMVRVKYVLEEICTEVGLDGLSGIWDDVPELQDLILWSYITLDEQGSDWRMLYTSPTQRKQFYTNRLAKSFNLADRVPDWSALEFVAAICTQFGLYYTITDNRMRLHRRRGILDATPDDWQQRAEAGTLVLDPSNLRGYKIDYTRDSGETGGVPGQLVAVTSGAGGYGYTLPFWSIFDLAYSAGGDEYDIAYSSTAMVSAAIPGTEKNTRTPRLAWDRGLQTALSGKQYHHAEAGDQYGDLSLRIDGASGIYTQWLRGVIELWADGSVAEFTAYLTLADVLRLRHGGNMVVTFFASEHHRIRIALKEVGVTLPFMQHVPRVQAKCKGIIVS